MACAPAGMMAVGPGGSYQRVYSTTEEAFDAGVAICEGVVGAVPVEGANRIFVLLNKFDFSFHPTDPEYDNNADGRPEAVFRPSYRSASVEVAVEVSSPRCRVVARTSRSAATVALARLSSEASGWRMREHTQTQPDPSIQMSTFVRKTAGQDFAVTVSVPMGDALPSGSLTALATVTPFRED